MLEQLPTILWDGIVSLRWVLVGVVALKFAKPVIGWFTRRLES